MGLHQLGNCGKSKVKAASRQHKKMVDMRIDYGVMPVTCSEGIWEWIRKSMKPVREKGGVKNQQKPVRTEKASDDAV